MIFDQSIDLIKKQNPDFSGAHLASSLIFWIGNHAPEDYSQEQLDELDRLTEMWIDELERQYLTE